jgi:hypothetical protein
MAGGPLKPHAFHSIERRDAEGARPDRMDFTRALLLSCNKYCYSVAE